MTPAVQAHCLSTIDLWHKVEFFLPFDVQGQVVEDRDADWAVRLLSETQLAAMSPASLWRVARVPDGKALSGFELYLGLFDAALMTAVTGEVIRAAATATEYELMEQDERNDVEGATCFAKISVTPAGGPMLDSISVSAAPWALGCIQQGGLASLDIDAFDVDLRKLQEQLQTFRAERGRDPGSKGEPPLSGADLLQLLDLFYGWAGFRPETAGHAVVAVRARVRKPQQFKEAAAPRPGEPQLPQLPPPPPPEDADEDDDEQAVEIEILNSFFAKDLQRVKASLADHTAGPALLAYLQPGDPARRVDLYSEAGQRRIVERLHPRHWPSGHWFANPRHRMSLMQQFALNTLFDTLAEPGLFAVNGPPGTGKTTMLREIFAENLVRRARVLASCTKAADAFVRERLHVSFDGVPKSCTVSRLRPDVTGFEMVVASSNNAAVENISRDLPKAAALGKPGESPWRGADGKPAIGYLQSVAQRIAAENAKGTFDELPDDEAPWGLFAAALGRRGNRKQFAERLFFLPQNMGKPIKGFDPVRHKTLWAWRTEYARTGTNFAEAKRLFAAAEARVQARSAALAAMADLHAQMAGGDAAAYCSREQAHADGAAFICREAEEVYGLCEQEAREAAFHLEALREQERLLHAARPAWWKRWLGLEPARRHAAMLADNLLEQHAVIGVQREAQGKQRAAQQELREAQTALMTAQEALKRRNEAWDCLQRQWDEASEAFPSAEAPAGIADIEQARWQIDGLWADEELNRLRCELFKAALQLHEAWLAEVSQEGGGFGGNLVALQHLLKGKRLNNQACALPIWQSLFMVVPVVSSTFASIASQFRELGSGALGWLFIDEAGQAVPQAAAGALWRCQRAVVVGDPRQIEPVFTVPFALVDAMARQAGMPADSPVLPHKASVQQLADADNRDGAWVSMDGGRRQWIGSPLRVHRRCVKAIFDIANTISYEGKMVYGLHAEEPPAASLDLGANAWVQVAGDAVYKQVVEAQLECVLQALVRLTASYGELPPLYIISPFKAVKAALKAMLSDPERWLAHWPAGTRMPSKGVLAEWCRKRIGTVHTFQGREESIVWMVLGCSAAKAGGASWASDKANLLNVAVTRAQHRLFVIGDAAVWATKPYFSTVAASLPAINASGFHRRMDLRADVSPSCTPPGIPPPGTARTPASWPA